MNILIATIKSWNIENANNLSKNFSNHNVRVITKKDDLTKCNLDKIKTRYNIFSSLVLDNT